MKSQIDDQGLQEAINKIENLASLADSKDGKKLDLVREKIFTSGPFLHKDTKIATEEESAKFERDNPEFFAFLRSLDKEFRDVF
jgi:hypothetical protein